MLDSFCSDPFIIIKCSSLFFFIDLKKKSTVPDMNIATQVFFFIYINLFLIGGKFPYNVVLVSAIQKGNQT